MKAALPHDRDDECGIVLQDKYYLGEVNATVKTNLYSFTPSTDELVVAWREIYPNMVPVDYESFDAENPFVSFASILTRWIRIIKGKEEMLSSR